jgi:serine/threonine protein phosphatase PrpC
MALTEDDSGEHEALAAWLGADADEPAPRTRSYRPRGPGRLLLCTDGLSRYLPDAESLRAGLAGSPLDDARSLVGYALDSGGHDNVTTLLIPVSA